MSTGTAGILPVIIGPCTDRLATRVGARRDVVRWDPFLDAGALPVLRLPLQTARTLMVLSECGQLCSVA